MNTVMIKSTIMKTSTQSEQLFHRAGQVIPGGVNSPVRAFNGVGGNPIYCQRGEGAYLIDADDNRYVDYVCSWGPLILGHTHPAVIKAVQETAAKGLTFGAPVKLEIELAEKICHLMPNIQKVRMVSSGTEATMTAIRLARGVTGRDKILKFEGCYHGHSDSLLIKAGSGALTLGVPSSPGVPAAVAQDTLTATFNDLDSVQRLFETYGSQIAAIIVEPVAGNMNCVLPLPGFLPGLRQICDHYKSLLILDEIITGFRVGLGGAQQRFHIQPDLTTLGKILGGGMPLAAFGGKKEIMDQLAPLGPVYQAGTLSGNPVALAAGLATLHEVSKPGFYEALEMKTRYLMEGILTAAAAKKIPMTVNWTGSMFGLFFCEETNVQYYHQVMGCHVARFKQFFHQMLRHGVYLAPSAFEVGFVSAAHDNHALDQTLLAVENSLASL